MSRENFALRRVERWQPPAYRPPRTRLDRAIAAARRFVDLQAASIWRDLAAELPGCDGDVLDVGAGAQPYRPLLASRSRYRAIDISAARERFGYAVADTTYFDGDRWPVADGSCDLVLATETLEHVRRPLDFLLEARRVLRDDGRVLLTVPFSARWHYVPYDYWRFTPSSLDDLLRASGFEAVVVHARGDELTVAVSKLVALIAGPLLDRRGGRLAARFAAAALLPLALPLVLVGRWSLRGDGGDDCLGWTVSARAC